MKDNTYAVMMLAQSFAANYCLAMFSNLNIQMHYCVNPQVASTEKGTPHTVISTYTIHEQNLRMFDINIEYYEEGTLIITEHDHEEPAVIINCTEVTMEGLMDITSTLGKVIGHYLAKKKELQPKKEEIEKIDDLKSIERPMYVDSVHHLQTLKKVAIRTKDGQMLSAVLSEHLADTIAEGDIVTTVQGEMAILDKLHYH